MEGLCIAWVWRWHLSPIMDWKERLDTWALLHSPVSGSRTSSYLIHLRSHNLSQNLIHLSSHNFIPSKKSELYSIWEVRILFRLRSQNYIPSEKSEPPIKKVKALFLSGISTRIHLTLQLIISIWLILAINLSGGSNIIDLIPRENEVLSDVYLLFDDNEH